MIFDGRNAVVRRICECVYVYMLKHFRSFAIKYDLVCVCLSTRPDYRTKRSENLLLFFFARWLYPHFSYNCIKWTSCLFKRRCYTAIIWNLLHGTHSHPHGSKVFISRPRAIVEHYVSCIHLYELTTVILSDFKQKSIFQ